MASELASPSTVATVRRMAQRCSCRTAVLVSNIEEMKAEFESKGTSIGNWQADEQEDGQRYQVFFVVAPDGRSYYCHEPISGEA
jgi:hypothetical protein